MKRRLTVEEREIRERQEAALEEVERQLADGSTSILMGERLIQPEPAWAATQALRKAWEVGGMYDGQDRDADTAVWWARVEKRRWWPRRGMKLKRYRLGRFPPLDDAPAA